MTSRIPCAAILAGGQSRRMGTDKVSIPLEGIPLIERVWSRIALVADRIVVVGGAPHLDRLGVPTLADLHPGAGSMGGIATALAHAVAAGEGEGVVFCVACDMPLLEPSLLLHLYHRSPGWEVVVPRGPAGYEPLCAVYRVTVLSRLEEEISRGNLRIWDLFQRVRTLEVGESELRHYDPELDSFLNVNRPEDLERARRALGGAAGRAPGGSPPVGGASCG